MSRASMTSISRSAVIHMLKRVEFSDGSPKYFLNRSHALAVREQSHGTRSGSLCSSAVCTRVLLLTAFIGLLYPLNCLNSDRRVNVGFSSLNRAAYAST